MKRSNTHVDFSKLLNSLPPIVARKKIDLYLGGIISNRYLANLDSEGTGPRRVRVGGTIGYLREDLIAWLEERSSMID